MTLEEAIIHCGEVADCGNDVCAREHKQLAAWLKELKAYKEANILQAILTAKCLKCSNAKACKENHWDGCIYEPFELTAVDVDAAPITEEEFDMILAKVLANGVIKKE